ncbi:hypothetical protein M0R04_07820 [Candidatus Dojkabacteria bacterium]|jgi:hypothetical protein|nr:hypothetical protein [Candidatus Dojkabacteria bacterium]
MAEEKKQMKALLTKLEKLNDSFSGEAESMVKGDAVDINKFQKLSGQLMQFDSYYMALYGLRLLDKRDYDKKYIDTFLSQRPLESSDKKTEMKVDEMLSADKAELDDMKHYLDTVEVLYKDAERIRSTMKTVMFMQSKISLVD